MLQIVHIDVPDDLFANLFLPFCLQVVMAVLQQVISDHFCNCCKLSSTTNCLAKFALRTSFCLPSAELFCQFFIRLHARRVKFSGRYFFLNIYSYAGPISPFLYLFISLGIEHTVQL